MCPEEQMECDAQDTPSSESSLLSHPSLTYDPGPSLPQPQLGSHFRTSPEASPLLHPSPQTPSCQQVWSSQHVQQITPAEYREQSVNYTQKALKELKASPEYKKHTQRCQSCWSSWYEGYWEEGCVECGGFAMTQPCPLCSGRCGRTWTRSVDMSHRMHEAHWDGECGLSPDEQAALMMRRFVQTEDELTDALQDLNTS